MSVIELHNFAPSAYPTTLSVAPIQLKLEGAAMLAILGNNGSGKSTLLKSIANLLPFRGKVFLSDKPALFFQQHALPFDIPAFELAVMGRYFHDQKSIFDASDYEAVKTIFSRLKIEHLWDKNCTELSGGEMHLVWLAQFFIMGSSILLLDEPFRYLDVYYRTVLLEVLEQECFEKGKLICFTMHEPEFLLRFKKVSVVNISYDPNQLELVSEKVIQNHLKVLERSI